MQCYLQLHKQSKHCSASGRVHVLKAEALRYADPCNSIQQGVLFEVGGR